MDLQRPQSLDCAEEELDFLARPYRWSRLADVLDAACTVDGGSGPRHPRSAAWASVYGREIPGETVGSQAAAVRRWLDADIADAEVRRNVALGMRAPGALERAVGAAFEAPEWAGRVEAALTENFVKCRWPARFLVPFGVDEAN